VCSSDLNIELEEIVMMDNMITALPADIFKFSNSIQSFGNHWTGGGKSGRHCSSTALVPALEEIEVLSVLQTPCYWVRGVMRCEET
jgi:hypothetical protein